MAKTGGGVFEGVPLVQVNLEGCFGLQRLFAKEFGENKVTLRTVANKPGRCVFDIESRRGDIASVQFHDRVVEEADIPWKLTGEETRALQVDPDAPWEWVRDEIKDNASSCKLVDVHEHEIYNPEEPGMGEEDVGTYEHIHLVGCTPTDLVAVAKGFGY